MKNFLLLASNVNVLPLLQELQRQPDLWNENTLRTKHPGTAHSEVSDILVRFNPIPTNQDQEEMFKKVVDDCETIPFRAWKDLPSIRPILFGLMRQVEAVRLGRIIITKLPPGKCITPHIDGGAPATYYQRYQVALQCLPGNVFKIEDEEVSFETGQVWQINNRAEHSVQNNSADDRIVMIIDLKSD